MAVSTKSSNLIDCLGGTTAVARMFNISPPSVHEWRARGIRTDRLIELARRMGREISSLDDLKPDRWHVIWPELAEFEGMPGKSMSSELEGRCDEH